MATACGIIGRESEQFQASLPARGNRTLAPGKTDDCGDASSQAAKPSKDQAARNSEGEQPEQRFRHG
jgi:hypothetical protein